MYTDVQFATADVAEALGWKLSVTFCRHNDDVTSLTTISVSHIASQAADALMKSSENFKENGENRLRKSPEIASSFVGWTLETYIHIK